MPKTKAFIEKARAKHGDRYSYGRVDYVHSKRKWFNTTPEHAEQVVNKVISSHAANHHHATIASTPQLALF